MSSKRSVAIAVAAWVFAANAASAITVGSVTVDALADKGAVEFRTEAVFGGPAFDNTGNIYDNDLGSWGDLLKNDVISFGFSGGGVGNVAGFDLYVFEAFAFAENSLLSLSLGGPQIAGTFIESVPNPLNSQQINTWGYDLDDLGVAPGAFITSDLFLADSDTSADIWAIGATSVVASVPLPATALLLLAGLGGLGALRRYRSTG